jgi:hypothetical protein
LIALCRDREQHLRKGDALIKFLNPLKNPMAWLAGLPLTAFIAFLVDDTFGKQSVVFVMAAGLAIFILLPSIYFGIKRR